MFDGVGDFVFVFGAFKWVDDFLVLTSGLFGWFEFYFDAFFVVFEVLEYLKLSFIRIIFIFKLSILVIKSLNPGLPIHLFIRLSCMGMRFILICFIFFIDAILINFMQQGYSFSVLDQVVVSVLFLREVCLVFYVGVDEFGHDHFLVFV